MSLKWLMSGPLMWAAAAIIALLVVVAMTWGLSANQTEQRIRSVQSSQNHIEYAEDRIDKKCLILEPMPMRECIREEIETARDHDRANQDLEAQEQMAAFTKIMGWTAIAGLLLGCGSVVLIFFTLRATQKMATDTFDIGIAQAQAYLSPDRVSATPSAMKYADGTKEYLLHVHITVSNQGQSPAYDGQVKLGVLLESEHIYGRVGIGVPIEFPIRLKEAVLPRSSVTPASNGYINIPIASLQRISSQGGKFSAHFFGEISWTNEFKRKQSVHFQFDAENSCFCKVTGNKVEFAQCSMVWSKSVHR